MVLTLKDLCQASSLGFEVAGRVAICLHLCHTKKRGLRTGKVSRVTSYSMLPIVCCPQIQSQLHVGDNSHPEAQKAGRVMAGHSGL